MTPKSERHNGRIVAGIQVRTNNRLEMEADDSRLRRLWERFNDEDLAGRIPDKAAGSAVYGVYTEYEKGAEGDYSVLAGVEITDEEKVPEEYTTVILEAGEYLLFPATGPMPEAAAQAWAHAWSYFESEQAPERAFQTDYEVYDPAAGTVTLHIGIK